MRSTRRLPFQLLLHRGVGEGATLFLELIHFTLYPYLIMLSVKQGGFKYPFLSLWYDSTWDWTPVSRTIGEYYNHYANTCSYFCLILLTDWVFVQCYIYFIYICSPTPVGLWGCPRGVMVKAMDCRIVVREFVLQSRYYIHFRARYEPPYPPSYGLNSTLVCRNAHLVSFDGCKWPFRFIWCVEMHTLFHLMGANGHFVSFGV